MSVGYESKAEFPKADARQIGPERHGKAGVVRQQPKRERRRFHAVARREHNSNNDQ